MGLLMQCHINDRSHLLSAKSIRVPTDIQSMNTVLKWVRNSNVRKEMYMVGNACAKENLNVRVNASKVPTAHEF